MTAEIFKIEMPRRTFVFISARTNERFEFLGRALGNMGAAVIGPQAYALSADTAPEAIRDALGGLEDGECVYLIGAAGGTLENHLLVPPRMEGGVMVR
jgi:hypothetical protein